MIGCHRNSHWERRGCSDRTNRSIKTMPRSVTRTAGARPEMALRRLFRSETLPVCQRLPIPSIPSNTVVFDAHTLARGVPVACLRGYGRKLAGSHPRVLREHMARYRHGPVVKIGRRYLSTDQRRKGQHGGNVLVRFWEIRPPCLVYGTFLSS